MTNPYDVQELIERLKGRGLDVAENVVKDVIGDVFSWTEDSIRLSSTPLDDIALIVLPRIKEAALKAADLIDGKVDM